MVRSFHVAVALTSLLVSAPAWAQTQDAQTLQGSSGDNLSSKLSKSGGVITPKEGVDPAMKEVPAPVPHPNSTPVIPPSATGGNTAK